MRGHKFRVSGNHEGISRRAHRRNGQLLEGMLMSYVGHEIILEYGVVGRVNIYLIWCSFRLCVFYNGAKDVKANAVCKIKYRLAHINSMYNDDILFID